MEAELKKHFASKKWSVEAKSAFRSCTKAQRERYADSVNRATKREPEPPTPSAYRRFFDEKMAALEGEAPTDQECRDWVAEWLGFTDEKRAEYESGVKRARIEEEEEA
jgi:hypothetical protein